MKVLMFGWEFPPYNSGGLGVACFGLAQAMANDGVDISFVLPKRFDVNSLIGKLIFADIDEGIKITEIDSSLSPYTSAKEYIGEGSIYGNSLFSEVYRYGLKAKNIAKKEDFDVIHAHEWLSFLAGIEAKKESGKPLVVHVHATEFDRAGGQGHPMVHKIERRGLEEADKIIAVSQFTKNMIVEKYGIEPSKIEVVHNSIDKSSYNLDLHNNTYLSGLKKSGYKIVLSIGRITLQKGIDYLVEAAYKVLQYDSKVLFVIAGSGDMEYQIIRRVAELGISDKFIFTGFVRGEEVNNLYKAADLFILPSVSEPFGLTPLEAIMNGTPVLISKQSGVSEVINHALKVDFWDVDEMVNKIMAVLSNKSMQETLLENSRGEVFNMSWGDASKKCIRIYRNLLNFVYN